MKEQRLFDPGAEGAIVRAKRANPFRVFVRAYLAYLERNAA